MLILKKFSAAWCGPCKSFEPVVEDVCEELGDSIRLEKIDVDKSLDLARKYNVRTIPYLVLEDEKGNVLWTRSGTMNKTLLLTVLQQHVQIYDVEL